MEPLTPNDPLWKVLGQARPVEPRPNFTQNVVRLARQTPQDRRWLAQIKGLWIELNDSRAVLPWAAVAAIVILTATWFYQPEVSSQTMAKTAAPATQSTTADADFPLVPEFETEWKNMEQMGDLLAVHDTSLLTDTEIIILLY